MFTLCGQVLFQNDNASQCPVHTQPAECSRMKCPHVIEKGQLRSGETYNMTSTVEKTNINYVIGDQNGTRKMTVIGHFKKQNFYWKNFIFLASLFRFILFTLDGMYSEITSLEFFEWSGISPIHATDSIRAVWTRNQSGTKIFLERHLSANSYLSVDIV